MKTSNGWAWEETYDIWFAALSNTYREWVEAAGAFVPGVAGAALLLLGGWLVALVLRVLITRFGTAIDRLFYSVRERVGQPHFELRWPISRIVAYTAYWLVLLFFLAAVFRLLGLPGLARIFAEALLYLPVLLAWAAVALALYMASGPVSNAVTAWARSVGLDNAGLFGRMARVVVLTFAGIIVVSQVGIDLTLLVNVVTIATAAFLGGAAVAFGIGAGGMTGNLIAVHQLRRSYRVGQRVAVGVFEGEILEITRTAVILDADEGRTMVPARLFNEQASVLKDTEG